MNERMTRLWAGAEAEVIGRGGLAIVARATGLALNTVKRGRSELRDGAKASRHVAGSATSRTSRPGGTRCATALTATSFAGFVIFS